MGYRVAARVAHLVFASLLLYLLPLDGCSSLPVVAPRLVVGYQFHALHVGCQIVAGVLHIGAYTQLLLRLCVVQPVLSLNVVGLLFLGVEGRVEQADFAVLREVARQSGSAKQRAEDVALLTVEVHLEGLHVLHRAKRCLAVCGLEVIVVFRDVADDVQRPPLVRLVSDVRLVVEEVGAIFAFRLH